MSRPLLGLVASFVGRRCRRCRRSFCSSAKPRLRLNDFLQIVQFHNYFRVRQQSVSHCASEVYMDPGAEGQESHEHHERQPGAEHVTVTARLIRSFAHRNLRHLVLRGVDLGLSGAEFLRLCRVEAARPQSGLPPPFRTFEYDCCKVSSFS